MKAHGPPGTGFEAGRLAAQNGKAREDDAVFVLVAELVFVRDVVLDFVLVFERVDVKEEVVVDDLVDERVAERVDDRDFVDVFVFEELDVDDLYVQTRMVLQARYILKQ